MVCRLFLLSVCLIITGGVFSCSQCPDDPQSCSGQAPEFDVASNDQGPTMDLSLLRASFNNGPPTGTPSLTPTARRFTAQEDLRLMELFDRLGSAWDLIGQEFSRSGTVVRTRYVCLTRKYFLVRVAEDPVNFKAEYYKSPEDWKTICSRLGGPDDPVTVSQLRRLFRRMFKPKPTKNKRLLAPPPFLYSSSPDSTSTGNSSDPFEPCFWGGKFNEFAFGSPSDP
jgi:hypothetical protein